VFATWTIIARAPTWRSWRPQSASYFTIQHIQILLRPLRIFVCGPLDIAAFSNRIQPSLLLLILQKILSELSECGGKNFKLLRTNHDLKYCKRTILDHYNTTPTRFQTAIMNHNTILSSRLAFYVDEMKISAVSLAQQLVFCYAQGHTDALYTGRFITFSVITNTYNKKTKWHTLMELFTATGKLIFFDN
jgi:hypothetical protein